MNSYTKEFLKGAISSDRFFEDTLTLFLFKTEVKKDIKLPPEFFSLLQDNELNQKFTTLLKSFDLSKEIACLRFVQNKKKEWIRRNASYFASGKPVIFVPVQSNIIYWFHAYPHTGRIFYPVIDL